MLPSLLQVIILTVVILHMIKFPRVIKYHVNNMFVSGPLTLMGPVDLSLKIGTPTKLKDVELNNDSNIKTMATIKERIQSLKEDDVFLSLEFFPPKTESVG